MKTIGLVIIFIVLAGVSAQAEGKKQQKVDFEEEMIDGQTRRPDGSYVVQKRSVDFVPLYRVREHFDQNIKSSIDYLK